MLAVEVARQVLLVTLSARRSARTLYLLLAATAATVHVILDCGMMVTRFADIRIGCPLSDTMLLLLSGGTLHATSDKVDI